MPALEAIRETGVVDQNDEEKLFCKFNNSGKRAFILTVKLFRYVAYYSASDMSPRKANLF